MNSICFNMVLKNINQMGEFSTNLDKHSMAVLLVTANNYGLTEIKIILRKSY